MTIEMLLICPPFIKTTLSKISYELVLAKSNHLSQAYCYVIWGDYFSLLINFGFSDTLCVHLCCFSFLPFFPFQFLVIVTLPSSEVNIF